MSNFKAKFSAPTIVSRYYLKHKNLWDGNEKKASVKSIMYIYTLWIIINNA